MEPLVSKFFEMSLELLCVAGTDGYFKRLNPRWEQLLGWTLEELTGRPFIEFVHPDDREATLVEARKLGGGGYETVSFDNRYRRRDGGWVWLRWTASADADAGVLLAAARDITAQRRIETELRRARDAAEAADRTKSSFLATMSHELRTPLNAIIGFSKLLEKNKAGGLGEGELGFVRRIHDNGLHLLSLINEILDISKIEAGQMRFAAEPCSVAALVETVLGLQESLAAEKGIGLRAEVPARLDAVRADAQRLQQVLMNLTSNAIKFTERGEVVVRVVPHAGSRRVAAIEVVDSGIGIAPDALARIFEPFEQVEAGESRAYAGTGLGLAISRSLASGMGMALAASSEPGCGSVFRVSIPAELGETAAPTPAADVRVRAPRPPTGRRVLVVDDNPDARRLITEHLLELGCEVRTAADGAEGLRVARGWRPELITLDLMMPRRNGWEVLADLRADEELRDVPTVVISMVDDERQATLAGRVEVLRKPVDRETLAGVLARLRPARRRALVVDDNPDARLVLAEQLEQQGWTVAEARDGAEGLAALAAFRPEIVVLDLMMPVMDGAEFLERIRAQESSRELPVVVVTAKDLGVDERRDLLRLASGVLQKSADVRVELERVLRRLDGGDAPERTP